MPSIRSNSGLVIVTILIIANILLALILIFYLISNRSHYFFTAINWKKARLNSTPFTLKTPSNLTSDTTKESREVLETSASPRATLLPSTAQEQNLPHSGIKKEETEVNTTIDTPDTRKDSNSLAAEKNLTRNEEFQDRKEEIRITNLVFTTGVDEMAPVSQNTSFHYSVGRVYSWMEVKNASPPTTLKHIYYFKDQKILEVELQVKYPRMRLWSYKTISERIFVGKWKLEVLDETGKLLTTGFFDITD